jgi:uncharacterized membrane protein YfcA
MEILGYTLAFLIGIIMGLIGAGGSILSSAILVYLFGVAPVISASYTLLNVGIISLIGSIRYYRKDLVDLKTACFFSLPALCTVYLMRRYIMPLIPESIYRNQNFELSKNVLIMLAFSLLMILISFTMIRRKSPVTAQTLSEKNKSMIICLGLVVGMLTGFVGVGGGFIIVPALVFFAGLDVKKAVGTSLLIITINTAIGFAVDFNTGVNYDWIFLMKFISITILGMIFSGQLSNRISTERLKRVFGYTILVVGCWVIFRELFLSVTYHS